MKRQWSICATFVFTMVMLVGMNLSVSAAQTVLSPSTGDISDALLFGVIAAVALILVIVMSILSKRRKK